MADQGIELTNGGSGGGQCPLSGDAPHGPAEEEYQWPEVKFSSYAISLSYLIMAMRAINILIFTWSTVVLLGGFVSMLEKKDFWCLTMITLILVPGLSKSAVINERMRWVHHLPIGFGSIVDTSGLVAPRACHIAGQVVLVLAGLMMILGGICLTVLVSFGVPIAAALSLWRLIQRDYGVAQDTDGSKANLTPALDVLYSLVMLQNAFYWLSLVFDLAGQRLTEAVVKEYVVGYSERSLWEAYFTVTKPGYEVGGAPERSLFDVYFIETKQGCIKDPSFAEGRNLVTYAVGMMASDKAASYVAGLRILDLLIGLQWPPPPASSRGRSRRESILWTRCGQAVELLTLSPSSGHLVNRLFCTVGPMNPYGGEAREPAARVLVFIAHQIQLEQFPVGMECVASLLHVSDERDASGMVLLGLNILFILAAKDERNCRVMSDTPNLVGAIMSPEIFARFHNSNHAAAWHKAAQESLNVLIKLANAPGDAGVKLRHEIVTSSQAVHAMVSILKCHTSPADLQIPSMDILKYLHFCNPSGGASETGAVMLVKILVSIFADDEYTAPLRIRAASTLTHIYTCPSRGVEFEYLNQLIEEIINEIRKVQNQLVNCCESSGGAEQPSHRGFSEPGTRDLEAQLGGPSSQDNTVADQQNSEQHLVGELKEALVRLHDTLRGKLVTTDDACLPPRNDGAATSQLCVPKPHGRRGSKRKHKKHRKGGKGEWYQMIMAADEEE